MNTGVQSRGNNPINEQGTHFREQKKDLFPIITLITLFGILKITELCDEFPQNIMP